MNEAAVLLKMKHGMVRLDSVWGVAGGRRPVKLLVKKVTVVVVSFSVLLRIPIIIESKEMVQNILSEWQQIKICFNQVNRGILTRECLGICVLLYHL